MQRVITSNAPCHVCHYPIQEPAYEGQHVKCPYCGTINEAIAANGVTIPTPVFVGFLAFGAGMFLGPVILAATEFGQRYLQERIKRGK